MSVRGLVVRLTLALVVVATATLACTAALDFDKLNSQTPDGSGIDATSNDSDVGPIPEVGPPPDMKACVPGGPCKVVGQQGVCAAGTLVCEASGVGTCPQVTQPGAEKCDGTDSDCDGTPDGDDLQAHQACGAGKFCDGAACQAGCSGDGDCTNANTCDTATKKCVCGSRDGCTGESSCADGQCLCGGKIKCGFGETCQGGQCVCGAQKSATGAVCSQPNPRCVANTSCGCDANSTCNTQETCASGVCNCGATGGQPEGPFCPVGTCDPAAGKCAGLPVDAGPDVGPDVGIDQGPPPPDGPQPDGVVPDGPQPDVPQPDGPQPDAPAADTAVDQAVAG